LAAPFDWAQGDRNAKAQRTKNSKHEIRNPKQYQMTKIRKIQNRLPSDSVFWIFPIWDLSVPEFVSDFDIRISDFVLGASWRKVN